MASSSAVTIGVAGALGRMGQVVTAALDSRSEAQSDVTVSALFDRVGTEGSLSGTRILTSALEAIEASRVIIDFTLPKASAALAIASRARGSFMWRRRYSTGSALAAWASSSMKHSRI